MKIKKPDLYTPDASNAINGVYPFSQTPSVFTVEDVTGRLLYATDHDAYVLDHVLGKNNPLNGPTLLTPREMDDVHSLICREVILPDYSENDSE
jgi:hypothetical protein